MTADNCKGPVMSTCACGVVSWSFVTRAVAYGTVSLFFKHALAPTQDYELDYY